MPLPRILSTFLRGTHRTSRFFSSSRGPIRTSFAKSISGKPRISYQNGYGGHTRNLHLLDPRLWIILSGQAAILGFCGNTVLAEDGSIKSNSGDNGDESGNTGLERIEDGSVVSNMHTSKWRVFTDSGRDYFFQGKLEPAERLFGSAIQEAKEGFGERDPHVASACNNLAELYRVKKEFDKAEPLYLEAVSILEEFYGPEDVRVGATLHNLGQLYLVQRKLEEARACYEVTIINVLPYISVEQGIKYGLVITCMTIWVAVVLVLEIRKCVFAVRSYMKKLGWTGVMNVVGSVHANEVFLKKGNVT